MCVNLQNTWSLSCCQFFFFLTPNMRLFIVNSMKMLSLMILAAYICKMILERGEQCQSCNSHPPNSHVSLLQLFRRYVIKEVFYEISKS